MKVNCEGCAGCCVDWRALSEDDGGREGRGVRTGGEHVGRVPLDDAYNLVPLTRDEIRTFLDDGLGDVMTPRLWRDEASDLELDGVPIAALGGKPAFFVGLRTPPKPVAPVGTDEERWLPTCTFLDPTTLQCRIHGDDRYPRECAEYPGHNLALNAETECERVEDARGGERLVDAEPPEDAGGLLLGPQALGHKLFVHPDPDRLDGVVERSTAGALTDADRAEFVATAAAASPGTTIVNDDRYRRERERALAADSWAGTAIAEWERRADAVGSEAPAATLATSVEDERGAPGTPGWSEE